MGYRGVTGGDAAELYPWPADGGRYPGVDERGGGTLFLRAPTGSMDMRSMRSFRRCCSRSAPPPCDLLCSMRVSN